MVTTRSQAKKGYKAPPAKKAKGKHTRFTESGKPSKRKLCSKAAKLGRGQWSAYCKC